MSLLKTTTADDVVEGGDVLGGFRVYDTDAYESMVKVVYVGQSPAGARFLGIHLQLEAGEYRENVYFTNRDGENFYVDKKSGKKKELPGFQTANELCLMTTGLPLEEQELEEKVIKLYDPEQQQETNQSVPVLVNVINKPVVAAIQKSKKFKQVKDAAGNYVDTDETREENTISKFFHHESQGTATEYKKDQPLGKFFEAWVNQNKGKVYDRTQGKTGGNPNAGQAGRPGQQPPASGATKSLFNR